MNVSWQSLAFRAPCKNDSLLPGHTSIYLCRHEVTRIRYVKRTVAAVEKKRQENQ
jgi:hypothetical protein